VRARIVEDAGRLVADVANLGAVRVRVTTDASPLVVLGGAWLVAERCCTGFTIAEDSELPLYVAPAGTYRLVWAESGRRFLRDDDPMAVYCVMPVSITAGAVVDAACDVTPGTLRVDTSPWAHAEVMAPRDAPSITHPYGMGLVRILRPGVATRVYSGRWDVYLRAEGVAGCERLADVTVRPHRATRVRRRLARGTLVVQVEGAAPDSYVAVDEAGSCGSVAPGARAQVLAGRRALSIARCRDDGTAVSATTTVEVRPGRVAHARLRLAASASIRSRATCEGAPCDAELRLRLDVPRVPCTAEPGTPVQETATLWVLAEGSELALEPGRHHVVAAVGAQVSPETSFELRAGACLRVDVTQDESGVLLATAPCGAAPAPPPR
jgi:hypothetical protein